MVMHVPTAAGAPQLKPGNPAPKPGALDAIKTGWTDFFTKLESDPDLQQSMLQFGAQLSAGTGKNFVGDVSSAALGATKTFQGLKADRKAKDLAAEDRKREEETRVAELRKTEAQTEKTEAETRNVGKSKGKPTDLVRTAQALAKVDPQFDGDVDKALVHLEGKKGEVTAQEFISDFIQSNSILFESEAEAAQAAVSAYTTFQGALSQVDGDSTPVSREDILELFPDATDEQIQGIINDPDLSAQVRQRLEAQ